MTILDSELKSRDITLLNKVQSYGFSSSHVRIWELDHKEGWAPKNWCLQIVVLEKILESPLDCSEIKPVSPKGSQPRIFTGRTDVQRPWGSNGNESTMIRTLSQWGRAENRLVQAGLYRAFCTLGKSLLSLNATGSHWRDSHWRWVRGNLGPGFSTLGVRLPLPSTSSTVSRRPPGPHPTLILVSLQ